MSVTGRAARMLLTLALLAASAGLGARAAAADSPAEEQRFVELIDQLRASRGAGALRVNATLAATACDWTRRMVADGAISHDPNLAAAAAAADPGWRRAGENVGKGPDVQALFEAFVASPTHLANLVDPAFDEVGVCVIRAGDLLYTTHRFLQAGSPPPTTAAPPPPTAPAPTAPPPTAPAPAPTPTAPPTTPAATAPPTNPPTTPAPSAPTPAPPTTTGTTATAPGGTTATTAAGGTSTTPAAGPSTSGTAPGGTDATAGPPSTGDAGPAAPSVVPAVLDQLRRLDPRG
ncbi:MAG: hypothetical protein IPM45_09055 [Acidimicrobiales bacterium]|nr:hypothetical protein [Acidimicrobiales bacterium]